MDARQQVGFDFVNQQSLELCAVIVGEGEDIGTKICHWNGSKYYATFVGPFERTVFDSVQDQFDQLDKQFLG